MEHRRTKSWVFDLRARFGASYWLKTVWSLETLDVLLAGFGGLWFVIEVMTYLSPAWPPMVWLRGHSAIVLVAGILYVLLRRRPRLSVEARLGDVSIVIRVADLFAQHGAYVISTNTTFDTDPQLISPDSLQGQVAGVYYDDQVAHMDQDIARSLTGEQWTPVSFPKQGKHQRFDVGTVAKVSPKGQVLYLLAVAEMNAHNTAHATLEDLRVGLAKLWDFIGTRGEYVPVVVPVLGSGRARVHAPREQLVQTMVRSFVAACGEQRVTPKMTIVISMADYNEHAIDLTRLGEFLRYQCQYTEIHGQGGVGVPL